MVKRKEMLKKREMLMREIDLLIAQREIKDNFDLNKRIEEKKKKYNFYNNLLKRM